MTRRGNPEISVRLPEPIIELVRQRAWDMFDQREGAVPDYLRRLIVDDLRKAKIRNLWICTCGQFNDDLAPNQTCGRCWKKRPGN